MERLVPRPGINLKKLDKEFVKIDQESWHRLGKEWLGSWARQRCLGLCCADALHPSSPKLIVIYKYEPSEPLRALVR